VLVIAGSEGAAADLAALLAEDERLEVVGAFAVSTISVSSISDSRPDVILLSRVPPSEIHAGAVPIVLLTDERLESWDFRDSVRARLPAQATPAEAFAALIAAAQGLTVLTPAQAESMLNISAIPQNIDALIEALTPRELQVLRIMAQGLVNKEIAEQLGISEHTAKFHVASILGKLGAATRAEAVAVGIRKGLIPI
jgi:DNA-binding NarL/FixJ family response regulator